VRCDRHDIDCTFKLTQVSADQDFEPAHLVLLREALTREGFGRLRTVPSKAGSS
jgi:hypothetical protein